MATTPCDEVLDPARAAAAVHDRPVDALKKREEQVASAEAASVEVVEGRSIGERESWTARASTGLSICAATSCALAAQPAAVHVEERLHCCTHKRRNQSKCFQTPGGAVGL